MITIRYKSKWSWDTELKEKSFSDLKVKTQFCRRNNIKEYELYNNGKRVVMLNNRMIDKETLEKKLAEISIGLIPEKSSADKVKRISGIK